MATEYDRYLAKAHESLASAEADLAAGRCNSAANRAYYAAFQAAVAALIRGGNSPSSNWGHDFVMGEFPSKLIHRRKVFSQAYAGALRYLFDLRLVADYQTTDVSKGRCARAVPRAREFVELIDRWSGTFQVSEPEADYGSDMMATIDQPNEYVDELKEMVSSSYPKLRLVVQERSPREFTLELHGDESVWEAHEMISDRRTEIADEHGIGIVILPLDESWRNQ